MIYKLLRKFWPYITLTIIIVGVSNIRFAALNKYTSPPGSDVSNHLTVLHAYQGNDVTGFAPQWRYPPIYFLLVLAPLLQIFPVFTALKASVALVSSIIAVPFFFIVRRKTKSNIIAGVTAFLFVFAEGYSEMVSWGGAPNFFGIFFMLVSVYFVLKTMESDSRKEAVFAGVFLSLTIGTHHLTALYYILVLVIFTAWFLIWKKRSASSIARRLLPFYISGFLFGCPYYLIYLNMYVQKASPLIQFNTASFSSLFANIPAGVYLFYREILFVWVILGILGFFILWRKECRDDETFSVMTSSLAITTFVLILLIPEQPTRPLYFLYVPLLLVFSVCLSNIQKYIRKLNPSILIVFLRRAIALTFVFFVLLFLTTASYTRLIKTVDYYHRLDDETIGILDWIRENTADEAVVAVNEKSWGWWIEGYAERKAFIGADLKLFMYKQQRMQVDIANKIFSGFHILENRYLRVNDNFPYGMANPAVAVNLGTAYQEVFFFDDQYSPLFLVSPVDNLEIRLEKTLLSATNKTMHIDSTAQNCHIDYNYSWNSSLISRTVSLDSEKPNVDVIYNASFVDSLIREVNITIWVSPEMKVSDYVILDNTIQVTLVDSHGTPFNARVSIIETNAYLAKKELITQYPNYTGSALLFTLIVFEQDLYAEVELYIEPKAYSKTNEIRYFNSYDLIRRNGIDYILINRGRMRDADKFFYDTQHFMLVNMGNPEVLLLEVKD